VSPLPEPAAPLPEPAPLLSQDSLPDEVATDLAAATNGSGPAVAAGDRLAADPTPRKLTITEGTIGRGQSLAVALGRQGISAHVVHQIATEMAPIYDFRYSQPGDSYRLVQHPDGTILEFRYSPSPHETYNLARKGVHDVAERWEAEETRERARIAGVVNSSLYDAVRDLGEETELAGDFAEIFAWDVDFSRSVRSGDEFAVLYERLYHVGFDREKMYAGPGRILAARYRNGPDEYRALYFQLDEGRGGYYRPDGSSVERQFLRAPLRYHRISSRYSLSRLHPILKVRRPHQGIDYAAPIGTPVWAVGDGRVIFVGWQGGFGKLVKIQHANGYVSYYGHLSRYAKGLRVGQKVHQKQVVGYVGRTGLATGPHLDFRIKKNGDYVNPFRIGVPAGEPIPPAAEAEFRMVRDQLFGELDPAPRIATNEAL
jgi:murein DD-endopeptidase MepM/ murein hydrolase activator NlpD